MVNLFGGSVDRSAVTMFGILSHLITVAIFTIPHFSGTFSQQTAHQCGAGLPHSNVGQEWVYTAPPRYVPAPPVDPNLQQEFLQLFMSYSNETKYPYQNEPLPPGLSQNELHFITTVCPKDGFFYSMSPQHVVARNMLQRYLTQLPTPQEVLRVARAILYSLEINPKIWYYALMGSVIERPDMSGYLVPQPLDAIPDLFVPAPVISRVLSRYKVVYGIGDDLLSPRGRVDIGPGPGPISNPGLFESTSPDDSYSYQHVAQESNVRENRIKFDRKLAVDGGNASLISSSGQYGKRTTPKYRRVRKNKQNQNHGHSIDHEHDHVPAESISAVVTVPLNSVKEKSQRRTSTTQATPEVDEFESARLTYGEDDDEYDELRRIHDSATNNSTRDITQRILRRRQRRKKQKTKVKRQAYSPFPRRSAPVRECTVINGTLGASNTAENKLWYWREDLMLNQHHWYWHQMYPINATRHGDRRAELFFFTHRNIVARYNAERLSNGLPRTIELLLKHGSTIEDGYNSFLIDMNSRKFWSPRDPHTHLTDILHTEDPDFARDIFLKDLNDLYYKLIFSIKDGNLLGSNLEPVPIRHAQGIDTLANVVEASELSVNPLYYDSMGIHNLGHQLLGLIQDPQYISRIPTGVMADTAVTMRDPVFYTFHSGVDNLFDKHKRTLKPYGLYDGDFPLVWQGVAISSVLVLPTLSDGHNNRLRTFWSSNRFPLEAGLDNSIHNGEVKEDVCALHLDHEPFTYKINVNVNPCVQSSSSQGTVRIFMAPRYDEYGQRFPLKVQRRLMFQLDSFPVQLRSGNNVIIRRSQDSALTKPWPLSLREQAYQSGPNRVSADYCGCGYPRHLLIPKGSPQGMQFDLFVMITNFDQDLVEDSLQDLKVPESCNSPFLMCGIPWRRYPDARPMGYPFDRMPYKIPVACGPETGFPNVVCKMIQPQWYKSPHTLEEYVRPVPNMASTVVDIQHIDTVVN